MSPRSDDLLEVRVRGRARLTLLCILSHGTALAALWLADLSWPVNVLLGLLLAGHALQYSRRQLLLSHPEAVLAVRWQHGRWYIQKPSGWHRCWPAGTMLVTPFLMAFNFRLEGSGKKSCLCLFTDTDCPEALHALRLRLLLEKA
ncbi:MAG: protein YgfX [Endozoicomonas sp.]